MNRQPLPTAPSAQFRKRPLVETAGEFFRFVPIASGVRERLKDMYYSMLMLRTAGRGLASHLPHGEIVRALPKHRHLSWNPDEYDAFRLAVSAGATALDIGANVGAYSLLLGQWVGAGGRVFAFEPSPEVFSGLTRHVALNGLGAVITPVPCAVGDCVGEVALALAGTIGESRIAAPGDGDVPSVTVPVTTIDEFCAAHDLTPSFIKVDVEGFELAVLRGARETIRRAGSALALFVEMHPSLWPMLGTSRSELLDELRAQSLAIEPLASARVDDVWAIEGVCARLRRR